MVDISKLYLNLQFFAEGGEGDGGAGAADTGVNDSQEAAVPARRRARRENPLANVKFGIQDDIDTNSQVAADTTATEPARRSFEELIAGEYKDDYDKAVQKVVRRRVSEEKAAQTRLNKQMPILQIMAERYGIDSTDPANIDVDALLNALNEDKRLYEDEAYREGVPVEMLMRSKQLERQQAALNAEKRAAAEQQQMQSEYLEMQSQAVALKAQFPEFDLDAEMQNPSFGRMVLKPPRGVGMSLESAYYAVHHREIMEAKRMQSMNFAHQAVQTANKMTANAIASGSRRPAENGVANVAGSMVRTDPRSLTKAERAEIRRRVNSGEKIRW